MIFKVSLPRITYLLLLLTLISACTQMAPPIQAPEAIKPQAPTKQAIEVAENTDAGLVATAEGVVVEPIIQLTPEQLIVQELNARPNMFALSKRNLAPHIKDEMLRALALFNAGDLEQSNTVVNSLINNELNLSSMVYVLAGDIAVAQMDDDATDNATNNAIDNDYSQATKHYQKALSLNADNVKAANRLAKIKREQGQFEQAEQLYTQAIDANPMFESSYRNRAVLRDLYLHKKEQALADYQIYAALLQHMQEQSEANELLLSEAKKTALSKDLKIVKRWLIDVGRQVDALTKAKAQNLGSN